MDAFYVLNTDAAIGASHEAAIGVLLRQKPGKSKPLMAIGFISMTIGNASVTETEYTALIEGLKLARRYEPTTLRVFTDSNSVASQINDLHPRFRRPALKPFWEEASGLIDAIGKARVTISWVPREMNVEANQRAADAFLSRRGKAWLSPTFP